MSETKKIKAEKVICPKCLVKCVDCVYQKDAWECKACGRLYPK